MTDYADIKATANWVQQAAAAEDTIWHVVSGPVYLCKSSVAPNSFGGSGVRFNTGDTVIVTTGNALWHRQGAGSVAVISRSAFNAGIGGF
jgi:hypothetical protein